jgi:hypothetical protein
MKRSLAVLALLVMLQGVAVASNPDPDLSTCHPWDETGQPFGTPTQCSDVDDLLVSVVNSEGEPIEGATVVIDLSDCDQLRIGDPNSLQGTTNAAGIVILNPDVGGCQDECTVLVRANNVTICNYGTGWRSTDWNGEEGDGAVTGADFAFFANAFKQTQDDCADYNGDGDVTGTDFSVFATSFKCPDSN